MRRALAKSLGAVEERFIISVKTDNAGGSNDNQFTIPTRSVGFTYDYNVETSDGQTFSNLTGNHTITFPSPGTYDIKISGNFPWYRSQYSSDANKLIDVKNWGEIVWGTFAGAFDGCQNLNAISATDSPDLSSVVSIGNMFSNTYYNIQKINNIENWDVSNVTSLQNMFYQSGIIKSPNFPIDLSNWDTSNVASIAQMFYMAQQPASIIFNLSNWDISNVTNMTNLFRLGGFTKVLFQIMTLH